MSEINPSGRVPDFQSKVSSSSLLMEGLSELGASGVEPRVPSSSEVGALPSLSDSSEDKLRVSILMGVAEGGLKGQRIHVNQ